MYRTLWQEKLGLELCFSMTQEGNMSFRYGKKEEVLVNRRNFLEDIGLGFDDCVAMQTGNRGSSSIKSVNRRSLGKGMRDSESAIQADCLVTNESGVFLWLVSADCLPMIFFSRKPFFLALAHISRQNSGSRFSSKIVKFLENSGVEPRKLVVYFGPSIKKESYLFDRQNLSQAEKPDWQPFIEETKTRLLSVDLVGFNISQLKSAGALEKNIFVDDEDTAISRMFFSHYRSRREKLPEARFATVAGFRK